LNEIKNGIDALVVAAGRGRRMGQGLNKVYLEIGGLPILRRTLLKLESVSLIKRIVVVIHPDDEEAFGSLLKMKPALKKFEKWVCGGEERSDSVRNGLRYLIQHDPASLVMVHDGARPFFGEALLIRMIEGLSDAEIAVPALCVADTVRKKTEAGSEVVKRDELFLIQTPQLFKSEKINPVFLDAESHKNFTDEAAYFEDLGLPVHFAEGERFNIKITTPEDLKMAEYILSNQILFS